MTSEEKALQLEKMSLIERMVLLLEEIAFQGSAGVMEKEKYLEAFYARSKQGATEIHGHLRTRSCACKGEVSKPSSGERIQQHANHRLAAVQEEKQIRQQSTR